MKKAFPALIWVLTLVLLGSVFVTSAATPQKIETVKLLSSVGSYKTLLKQEIEKFNNTTGAKKGVKLEIETQIDKYREVLELAIKAGNSPDLFGMPAGQESTYVANKWVMPLEVSPGAGHMSYRRIYLP